VLSARLLAANAPAVAGANAKGFPPLYICACLFSTRSDMGEARARARLRWDGHSGSQWPGARAGVCVAEELFLSTLLGKRQDIAADSVRLT